MKEAAQKTGLSFVFTTTNNKKKNKTAEIVYVALVAVLLFIGVAGSLRALFLPEVSLAITLPVGLAATIVLSVCYTYKKLRLPALVFIILLIAVWTILLWSDMSNGFNLVATQVGEVLGRSFGRNFPIFSVSVALEEYSLSMTIFLIPVCLVLALLCSLLVFTSSVVLTLIVVAVVLFATVVLNQTPATLPSLALIVAAFLIVSASFASRSSYQGRYSKGFLQMSAGVLITSVAAFAVLWLIAEPTEYQAPPVVTQAHQTVQRTLDTTRYGVNTELGMPDGDFTDLKSLTLSEEAALEVTMEQPESLWLRGYVGSVYTKSGWEKDDPKKLYEYAQLFYWLHEDGFFGQTQLADAAYATALIKEGEGTRVTVDNLGASSRNVYAPYEVYWAEDSLLPADGIGDTALYSAGLMGTRTYSYSVVTNQVKQFPRIIQAFSAMSETPDERASNFLAVEGYYAQYAQEMYLEVDPELSVLLNVMLPKDESSMSFNAAKQAILDLFAEEVSYSESITPWKTTDDFVSDFLTVTKEGYSIHYASAGTILFRHLGFPARYVEGYLITPSDVEGLQRSSVLTLDGTHAHAWTEVYLDGVGWIPVELTPPYLNIMEQADTLQGVSPSEGTSEDELTDESGASDSSLTGEDPNAQVTIEQREFPWWLLITGALVVIVLVLTLVLWRIFKRRKVLRERDLLFNSDNAARAITAMYHYCRELLDALGMETSDVERLPLLAPRVEEVLPGGAERFARVFMLYEEAAYSQHTMGTDKRDELALYTSNLAQLLKERSKGLQSLRVKLLLCLL